MADILSIISLVSFIVAGICFALALFFWFYFHILRIIGDLTGWTARKSIAKMRQNNEASGNKSYRSTATNISRGKLTGTVLDSAKPKSTGYASNSFNTNPTSVLEKNKATGIRAGQTTILENQTTEFLLESNATEPLAKKAQTRQKKAVKKKLKMLDEVIYTHTDEVIE